MEKKLRVQLYDENGVLIKDRLVNQDIEFMTGPKEIHEGIFRIEATLMVKEDIDKFKLFLDKLSGILPLTVKSIKKSHFKTMDIKEYREEILNGVIEKGIDQDKFIEYLREKGFKFMMTDFLNVLDFPNLEIKERHKDNYQWMLRCIKHAKNPKNDKYDPLLIFGIKFCDERSERIVVYVDGKFHDFYKIPIPEKPKETFKKTQMIKFPPYMVEEEREKFRFELRQYKSDPDKPWSKIFNRWVPYIQYLPKEFTKSVNNDT